MNPPDPNHLIREAALGRHPLDAVNLPRVISHIAVAGFDPVARERSRGELAGVRWRGRILQGSDRLPPAERHFLKHVVVRREWPVATTLARYLRSLRDVIEDPDSGIVTSLYQGEPQLGVIRETRALRGPDGFDWVIVEYRVTTAHWVTAYQPRDGLHDLDSEMRSDLRWWREPRRSSE